MKRFFRNKWFYILLVLIICGAGTYLFMKGSPSKTGAITTETLVTVKRGEIKNSISGTSQLESKQLQTILSPADGTIQSINLKNNQQVKLGDVLVQISNPTLENDLRTAKQNEVEMEQALSDIQTQINHLTTIATGNGKIVFSPNIDVGSVVGKSSVIATISDVSHLMLKVPFILEDAVQLKIGDTVEITLDGFLLTKTGTVNSISKSPYGDSKGEKLLDVQINLDNDNTMDAGLKASVTATVQGHDITSQSKGTLQYAKVVTVLANVSGTIDKINFTSGDIVHSGERISSITNDTINNDLANKQTAIDQQKLVIAGLQDNVTALTVKAPFDGVFSTDFINQKANILSSLPVGTTVSPRTQFGAVADLQNMQLPIQVDELDLPNVKSGLQAQISVDSIPGRTFNATVTQVSTVGTTTSGVTAYTVVLSLKNTNGLKYGMTATGEILLQDRKNVLTLPIEAVHRRAGVSYVTLKSADGTKSSEQQIQIGARSKTAVEITSGLKEGDKVVVVQVQRTQQTLTADQIAQLRKQFQQGAGGNGGGGGGFGGGGNGGNGGFGGGGNGGGGNGTRGGGGG